MLALVVPFVVFVIAELVFVKSKRTKVSDLSREMTAKGGSASWQMQLSTAQAQAAGLQADLDELKASFAKANAPLDHAASLKEVSRLCTEGGLALITSAQDAANPLAPSLQAAAPLLATQNHGTAPEMWRIEMQGSYAQMRKLLDALAAAPSLIVPLHLGMKLDEESRAPAVWTLTLWL